MPSIKDKPKISLHVTPDIRDVQRPKAERKISITMLLMAVRSSSTK